MRSINLRLSIPRFPVAGALALAVSAGGIGAWAQNGTQAGPSETAMAAEKPFLDENAAAMDRMMAGMEVKPTGDVDRDFVAMMAPHHQGAIEMAMAYLRHGRNEQLRRIAQEIIIEQQQEIAAMRLAIDAPIPPPSPAPTGIAPQSGATARPPAAHGPHHTTNR